MKNICFFYFGFSGVFWKLLIFKWNWEKYLYRSLFLFFEYVVIICGFIYRLVLEVYRQEKFLLCVCFQLQVQLGSRWFSSSLVIRGEVMRICICWQRLRGGIKYNFYKVVWFVVWTLYGGLVSFVQGQVYSLFFVYFVALLFDLQ